jgi:hypothetical protein
MDSDPIYTQIVESTSLNGFEGVSISQVSRRIPSYEGEVWWLPLGGAARQAVDESQGKFEKYLLGQVGKPYDFKQAVGAGTDILDGLGIGHNREDFSKFLCSELAAAALEQVQAFGKNVEINCSEVTPIDLCMFNIYDTAVRQLQGNPGVRIRAFNSMTVTNGWGA